jgi:hypothetical protein
MQMIYGALAPGQQFIQPGDRAGQPDQMVTVARLEQDRFGVPLVTFLLPDGRDLTTYADQIEAAIAEGALTEVRSRELQTA